jgi:hypothetical protein
MAGFGGGQVAVEDEVSVWKYAVLVIVGVTMGKRAVWRCCAHILSNELTPQGVNDFDQQTNSPKPEILTVCKHLGH